MVDFLLTMFGSCFLHILTMFGICFLHIMLQILSIFIWCHVTVCTLDSLTNLFLFCLLSLFAVCQPDDHVAAKSTTSRLLPRTARFIWQLSNYFVNLSSFQYICYKSLLVAHSSTKIYYKINSCETAALDYILNYYWEEDLCWYYMSHQLVSTWYACNDLSTVLGVAATFQGAILSFWSVP
jgi:hypothetical protein